MIELVLNDKSKGYGKMKRWKFSIDNDKLIELVLLGKKTATSSIYDKKELPMVGEETIICFSDGKDACVVKTIDYKILKFNEMTEEIVRLEGEGDLSLDCWKDIHYKFFKTYDSNFNDETLIVFEIFEL